MSPSDRTLLSAYEPVLELEGDAGGEFGFGALEGAGGGVSGVAGVTGDCDGAGSSLGPQPVKNMTAATAAMENPRLLLLI